MRCCNSGHGCEFLGVLDEVTTHFLKDCAFHVVTCNTCNAAILRNGIVRHYTEQRCQAASYSTNDGDLVGINGSIVETESKMNAALDAAMERLCAIETQLNVHVLSIESAKRGISANGRALSRLLDLQEQASGAMTQHVEELSKRVDIGKRVSSDVLSGGTVTSAEIVSCTSSAGESSNEVDDAEEGRGASVQDSPDRCASDATDDTNKVEETLKLVLQSCERIHYLEGMLSELQICNRLSNSLAYFHIQDFADIERESLTKELVTRASDVFQLFGYSAKLQVETTRRNGVTYLGVFLCLCHGPTDSCLKWPFTLPYTVMLVHPTCEKNNIEHRVWNHENIDGWSHFSRRPLGHSNRGLGRSLLRKLEDVAKQGFVHNNSITVGVRIL
ncbi:uncharacterized protein LOC135393267 [Ornithodoros turicata]|uniref:uncharacterized protein LOC135393267 n=1 Tax=Ornithodoros turicata TaxID=34597 RepID=UPI003139F742